MRAGAAAVLFAVTAAAGTARASPEDVLGYGGRSPAMAGTGAAWAIDYEAAYTNPALLSALRARTLAFGFQGATFRLARTAAMRSTFKVDAHAFSSSLVSSPLGLFTRMSTRPRASRAASRKASSDAATPTSHTAA